MRVVVFTPSYYYENNKQIDYKVDMTNQVQTNFSGNLSDYKFSSSARDLLVTEIATGIVTTVSAGLLNFQDSSINAFIAETCINSSNSGFSRFSYSTGLSNGGYLVAWSQYEYTNYRSWS